MIDKNLLLKSYLENLQVNIIVADYIHCSEDWKDFDYIPNYNKFYFICDGEGWLKVGDKEYYPKPGQMFLMPSGIIQSYSTINKNTFKKYWCHFTATVEGRNLFDIIKLPYFVNVIDKQNLENIFKELIANCEGTKLTSALRIKSCLLEMIALFIENTVIEKISVPDSSSTEKLNNVLNYIDNHLSQNIAVEELAKLVYLHPNYFIKFFKKHLGTSPMQYINNVRLEKSKNLLRYTDMTITEIAKAAGFSDLFYFSKSIKNYTGFSPTEFRNMNNSKKS